MMKFVLFAALVAVVSANGYLAPIAHAPIVHASVGHAVVGSAVVGHNVVGHKEHTAVNYVPKVVSQPIHIAKPATFQVSSGHSYPGSGKVIAAAPVLHAPVLAHAAPVVHAPLLHAAPLAHGY